MADLQVQAKAHLNTMQINIKYPSASDISYNFVLTISIFEQNLAERTQYLAYKTVFYTTQREIVVKDLKFSTMYKIVLTNKYGADREAREKTKNVFAYTEANRNQQNNEQHDQNVYAARPQSSNPRSRPNRIADSSKKAPKPTYSNIDLCNSELLVKTLAQSNHIVNKDKAHKFLLQSRKCRNIDQFINEKHGRRVNPTEVGDKRMLFIQSKLLFHEIYKYREGCKFFQNDWCMGPFYSYDGNEKDVRRQ